MAALLITYNHASVWGYGYSFFKTSCLVLAEERKARIQDFVAAIGISLSGDKEAIAELWHK